MVRRLKDLMERKSRVVAGLMSGTSLDGVDCAIALIRGSGRSLTLDPLTFISQPYPDDLRDLLLRNSAGATSSVRDISQLNFRLAHAYHAALVEAAEQAGMPISSIDAIGSHGQTIHHVPDAEECAGISIRSTLQIGDPSVLANLCGVVVVGDFRVADMAVGGQGAPLVSYFDRVVFTDASEDRVLLNIGGIANITVLPRDPDVALVAFDTGPGNMVMDAIMKRLIGRPFDKDGATAARGVVCEPLLDDLLTDDFFAQPPPRTTGRERYGVEFVEQLLERATSHGCEAPEDLMATVTELTARSISDAIDRFVRPNFRPSTVIASGGGARNLHLTRRLTDLLAPTRFQITDDYGIDGDAKEALCFAVLAQETLNGCPSNVPSATGADRATILGKICLPGS